MYEAAKKTQKTHVILSGIFWSHLPNVAESFRYDLEGQRLIVIMLSNPGFSK